MKWITAANLGAWAGTIAARKDLAKLIGDLAEASARDISSIRFPEGDKSQIAGPDGVLWAEQGDAYVPDGKSVWEFGTNADPIDKANSDYRARTEAFSEEQRKETTFVFVTPRTMQGTSSPADWEAAHQGAWKAVKCIDAVLLERWLEGHPAVAARFARYVLNLAPNTGAISTDEFWEAFSKRYKPQLTEEVVLAGREEQATALVERMLRGEGRIAYSADSSDEVVAFAVAAIRKAEKRSREFLESKSIIVETEEAARLLVAKNGLIYLPRGQARRLDGQLTTVGPTLISNDSNSRVADSIRLERPRTHSFASALKSMDYGDDAATALARKCGRSLVVLERQIPRGSANAPEWVQHSKSLIPAMLAGAWNTEVAADVTSLTKVAGVQSFHEFLDPLRALTRLADPPINNEKELWAMRAPVDAFIHLGHLLGEEHLKQLRAVAIDVFSKGLEAPKAEQVFRRGRNTVGGHSSALREGLMTTLLLVACLHEVAGLTVSGVKPQQFVNDVVNELPGLRADIRMLESLRDNLPLLAEAATDPFLDALEHFLEGDASGILPIFEERTDFLSARSSHVEFLWALETLAWIPSQLQRVALVLARMAAVDPGGSLSNRPIASLRGIFLSWSPNTDAGLAERMAALAKVVTEVPEISWQLLERLLPNPHDTSSPHPRPRFRETDEGPQGELTYGEVWASESAIVDMALSRVANDANRWTKLVDRLAYLRPEPWEKTVCALDSYLESAVGDDKALVWDILRKEVKRHRRFADTDWAMSEEDLCRIESIVDKHRPNEPLLEKTWLFDEWTPDVIDDADGEDSWTATERARQVAAKTVWNEAGVDGIVELMRKVKLPNLVIDPVLHLELPIEEQTKLLRLCMSHVGEFDAMASALVRVGLHRFERPWLEVFTTVIRDFNLSDAKVATMLFGMRDDEKTWDLIATLGRGVVDEYWRNKPALLVDGPIETSLAAIERYMAYGRPMDALQSVHRRFDELPSQTIMRLLDGAIQNINGGRPDGTMVTYYVERAFDLLEARKDVDETALAQLEFRYITLLEGREGKLTIHRLLLTKPEVFVEILSAVFRGKSEPEPEHEVNESLVRAGYRLLKGIRSLPGQTGGDVDAVALEAWCNGVRDLAVKADRGDIADQRIGAVLARAPDDPEDGAWPHSAVRAVIEIYASDDIEQGLSIERYNMRGVFTKSIGEGGKQERALAARYADWADRAASWPRTSRMLKSIADGWEHDAKREDVRAKQEGLLN